MATDWMADAVSAPHWRQYRELLHVVGNKMCGSVCGCVQPSPNRCTHAGVGRAFPSGKTKAGARSGVHVGVDDPSSLHYSTVRPAYGFEEAWCDSIGSVSL
jgi:hypothetical protein